MTQNMGIGDIGKPHILFVRDFRFVLKGKYLSESFNKAVQVDYANKELTVSIYEVCEKPTGEIHAHTWADKLESGEYKDEELHLTTYDGCGNELYSRCFQGLKIVKRKNGFDYSSSEAACHVVSLSFEKYEKKPTTDRVHQTMAVEASVDHLNARMFTR